MATASGKSKPKPRKATKRKAPKAKTGCSQKSAHAKRIAFAHAYLNNGKNGTQAAITAGYSEVSAHTTAFRLLKNAEVIAIIDEALAKAAEISGLTVQRTLAEVARLAYFDPRKLFDSNGQLLPVHELPDDAAATLASIEVTDIFEGNGKGRKKTGELTKIKVWDKNSALEKAMKFHGLYKADNDQKTDPLTEFLKSCNGSSLPIVP